MTDQVFIQGLECQAVIGVFEWEKQIRQTLLLDLEMAWDNRAAAAADDYSKALCYDTVSKAVTALVQDHPHELVETVAEKVADLILTRFQVAGVRVRVSKPGAVANARTVGVQIQRGTF
ncbi:dihydroneopterin aldolase [Ferrimonas balearica DSM 9799]|uniref:7,8-dihydroneopterin aldolase n=1 Tax=Ferrimonas balearica (strain DSM 9799 / CCM 4581 / KCTC 23876 / PAT) TaxID=550540 RepID=E1SWK3_FERBD|nr:dihydroneopterin aldolase [Ferrimonas balearica]ADN77465.1 dihydroneopterin aldolase [Ferrimonas balearica DSM 9799]MBY5980569.1 dihydroneopterin aldolase [Ferrimonas balearica]